MRAGWEWCAVLVLAVLFALLNLQTFRLYPAFGDDDVLLSDAGVNLALGHGFTSSAWPGQAKEEFFSGNLPLYPLCLGAWLRVAGFGLLQLRVFSYVCGSVALVCIGWALRRREWIASAGMRVACVAVMFCSAPVMVAVRRNRYDGFQLLLCAILLCLWAASIRPRLKVAALFAMGLVIAVSGFQVAAFVGLLCLAAMVWERSERANWNGGSVVAGLAAGGALVCVLYWQAGVLHGLMENVAWGRSLDAATPEQARVAHLNRVVFDSLRDTAMVPLLLVLLGCAVATKRAQIRREAGAAVALTLAIMLALEAAVHFAAYYRWMTAGLLSILAFRISESSLPEMPRWGRRIGEVCLGAVAVLGMAAGLVGPSLLVPYAAQSRRFEEMARANLRAGDVVFGDYQAYCAVKPLCAQAYFPGYLGRMSAEEEASVNVVMVRETHPHHWYIIHFGEYLDRFARHGKWERVASAPLERTALSRWLARWFPGRVQGMEFTSGAWELGVYRRVE